MIFVAAVNLDTDVDSYELYLMYLNISLYSNKRVTFNETQAFIAEELSSLINSTYVRTKSVLVKEEINVFSSKLIFIEQSLGLLGQLADTNSTLQVLTRSPSSNSSQNSNYTSIFVSEVQLFLGLLLQLGKYPCKFTFCLLTFILQGTVSLQFGSLFNPLVPEIFFWEFFDENLGCSRYWF